MILIKFGLIYVQKSTTFVNACDFSVNLISALIQWRREYGFDGFGRTHQFSKMGSRTHQFLRKFNRNAHFDAKRTLKSRNIHISTSIEIPDGASAVTHPIFENLKYVVSS